MRIIAILLIALLGLVSYSSASNQGECELCGIVVNYVEGFVLKNKTQDEIVTELEKMCNLISPSVKPTCDTIVKGYTEVIINLIFMKENPTTICQQLKLCEAPSNYYQINKDTINNFKDGLIKKASLIGRSRYDDTKECAVCKLISGDIIVMVKQNKTQQEIITELNSACQLIKGFDKECIEMVDQYVPAILDVIESENPQQICEQIKLCAPQNQQSQQRQQNQQNQPSNHHNFNGKPIGRVSITKNF